MFYLHGKSTGRIESEAQLKSDVRRAWDTIAPRYAGKHKVIVGHSRGTDLAAAVAAEIQPDLTVLVSPFFSMAAIAREQYPLVSGFLPHVPGTTHDDVHKSPRYTNTQYVGRPPEKTVVLRFIRRCRLSEPECLPDIVGTIGENAVPII